MKFEKLVLAGSLYVLASTCHPAGANEPIAGEISPGEIRPQFVLPTAASTVAFSPDSTLVATGTEVQGNTPDNWRGDFKLWSTRTGKLVRELSYPAPQMGNLSALDVDPLRGGLSNMNGVIIAFSPDGKTVATLTSVVSLWDVSTGKLKRTLKWWLVSLYSENFTSIDFSPNGKDIMVGITSGENKVRVFDVETGKQKWVLPISRNNVGSVTYPAPNPMSPDGKMIATGGGSVRLWRIEN